MCECLYVYYMCWMPSASPEEGDWSPEPGDTGACAAWVLETNPGSTTETASALNH